MLKKYEAQLIVPSREYIPFWLADPEVKEDETEGSGYRDLWHFVCNEEEAADALKYRKKDLTETLNLELKQNLGNFLIDLPE